MGAFVFDVADREPEQFHDRGVVGEVTAVLGHLPQLVVQRLDRVGTGYESRGCLACSSGWLDLPIRFYGETVRNKGSQGNRYGQAVLFDGLRARVSRWPPLRLVRLRRERESVSVGSPNPFPLENGTRGTG